MSTAPPILLITQQNLRTKGFREQLAKNIYLEMVNIPPGSFLMGASKEEPESYDDERPQHLVSLQPFSMGRYPITQEQWQTIMGDNPSNFKDNPTNPVDSITWDNAQEFCQKLSKKTQKTYRLPTEAEWEYACRAGTTTPFHFGETIDTNIANYNGNEIYGRGIKGIHRGETIPVGSFKVANAFGLYDMHGNVWEWCEDTWHENYDGAPTDGTAWIGKNDENSSKRVMRGGSWYLNPNACRSAFRYWNDPVDSDDIVGLRVVCSASRTL
jgi:formylglycine-generating enzyme required for sulfatase activity